MLSQIIKNCYNLVVKLLIYVIDLVESWMIGYPFNVISKILLLGVLKLFFCYKSYLKN